MKASCPLLWPLHSFREASVPRDFPRQLHHRVPGALPRLQHGWQQQRASAGHSSVHFPATGPHCVPGRLPELHREGPDRAVHDGGAGARRLVLVKI